MSQLTAPIESLTLRRPELRRPLLAIATVNVVIVLIMAVLGGRFFVSPSIIDIHGYIGNFVFLLVIAQAALLFLAGIGGRLGKALLGLALLTVLLVIAQIGLGYSGRESATALSLHIPNGVLIFGLSAAILSQLPHVRAAT